MDLAYQDFDREVASLATEYAPPGGAFLLADEDGLRLGCVGVRRHAVDAGEMKRLYVRPEGRGHGVGRLLVEGIVGAARTLGYRRLVLDTLPTMADAQRLYRAMGFRPTAPYRFSPVPGTAYYELDLVQTA